MAIRNWEMLQDSRKAARATTGTEKEAMIRE
jgi:hypothetical protein